MNHKLLFRFFTALAVCIPGTGFTQEAVTAQITGAGSLHAASARTDDGRFALSARLVATPPLISATGYGLAAKLTPTADSKAVATACAVLGNDLFRNGFEN